MLNHRLDEFLPLFLSGYAIRDMMASPHLERVEAVHPIDLFIVDIKWFLC